MSIVIPSGEDPAHDLDDADEPDDFEDLDLDDEDPEDLDEEDVECLMPLDAGPFEPGYYGVCGEAGCALREPPAGPFGTSEEPERLVAEHRTVAPEHHVEVVHWEASANRAGRALFWVDIVTWTEDLPAGVFHHAHARWAKVHHSRHEGLDVARATMATQLHALALEHGAARLSGSISRVWYELTYSLMRMASHLSWSSMFVDEGDPDDEIAEARLADDQVMWLEYQPSQQRAPAHRA